MTLTAAAFKEYDTDRMVVLFTMLDGTKPVSCAVTTDAMDQMDPGQRAKASQREQQFVRLSERIAVRAAAKFAASELEGKPPGIILRAIDFRG